MFTLYEMTDWRVFFFSPLPVEDLRGNGRRIIATGLDLDTAMSVASKLDSHWVLLAVGMPVFSSLEDKQLWAEALANAVEYGEVRQDETGAVVEVWDSATGYWWVVPHTSEVL